MTNINHKHFGNSLLEIKTIGYLLDKLSKDVIDLNPVFQRDYVWDIGLEKEFITTAYNGGDIGRIILNRKTVDGDTKWLCVDGKQKLTALKKFKENKFRANVGEWGKENPVFFREMSKEQREQLKDAQIPIRMYIEMSEEKQSDLFKVIQNGKALENGELVNGTNNDSSKFIRKLRKNIPRGFFTPGDKKRMKESDSLCRFVYLCVIANEKVVASPEYQTFHKPEKCSDWVLDTTIKKEQKERTLKSFRRLTDFIEDGGSVSEKKAATFVYLAHFVYIHEKKLDDIGKKQRNKVIETLKNRVVQNLGGNKNTNYYLRLFLDSHIKTVKEILEELDP
ncbi:hypothetical protein D1R32_gp028 [Tunisvirus fontaine2]|uniref:GmrSD restriction endonucleases N-terminal domain-containing protein n=1 Tax=Tunisvirus fontaine2 TaxID=1421067 RepID=V9SDF9_9VIRU|nr:hypothetical protein D1R32_gp028 [Tunisvirus fontaine2]AHC54745.1 hypothetical protein TNS_ORF27 [Tunisvirus fontaine2]